MCLCVNLFSSILPGIRRLFNLPARTFLNSGKCLTVTYLIIGYFLCLFLLSEYYLQVRAYWSSLPVVFLFCKYLNALYFFFPIRDNSLAWSLTTLVCVYVNDVCIFMCMLFLMLTKIYCALSSEFLFKNIFVSRTSFCAVLESPYVHLFLP
jgi:hypothetical protein